MGRRANRYKEKRLAKKQPVPSPIPPKVQRIPVAVAVKEEHPRLMEVPIKPVVVTKEETSLVMEQQPLPCERIEKDDIDKKERNDCFTACPSNGVILDDSNEQSTVDEDSTDDELDKVEDPWPYKVGPALQVLSVTIFKPDHSDSRVGGDITITDHNMKKKYYIYKGDKDKLEPGWNDLVLTRGPVASVMGGDVEFELTSEDGNVRIFNHKYNMNKATENFEERTCTLEGDGNRGYRCKMVFTKTPFATIAKVGDMFVRSPSPPYPGKEFYELRGKITLNKLVCFDTQHDEALKGMYLTETSALNGMYVTETSFPFYNTVYIVPVDSPLALDVELYCDGLVISKRRFEMNACSGIKYPSFECEAGGFVFHMEVQWMAPYHFFDVDVQLMSSPTAARHIKYFGLPVSGALVEVFSVFFGDGNSAAPCDIDLYGAIVVGDGDKHFNILAGKKDCPCKLLTSEKDEQQFRTLPLKWPDDRWVVGENFDMNFKLKDVKNDLLCVGLSSWRPRSHSRYDIRLCDVFEGVNGYLTALHYSVFKNGKKAKVSVQCSKGPYSIYGSVFAQYNNYDYPSTYEKQCYRSMLFKRSEENPLLVESLQIPLLKSQVSAPSDCDELIVCGDLWVRPSSEMCAHQLFHFDTTEGKTCNIGWGILTVKVHWV